MKIWQSHLRCKDTTKFKQIEWHQFKFAEDPTSLNL